MLEFNPTIDGKIYKLLKVFAETASEVAIKLFVDYKGVQKSLGSLSDEYPSIDCEFEFDETFQLSHSSSTFSVHVWGFTIPASFELKDLANCPLPLVEAQSPKLIVDGEYRAYQALLAKKNQWGKHQTGEFGSKDCYSHPRRSALSLSLQRIWILTQVGALDIKLQADDGTSDIKMLLLS